jgi:hypothetical protein
MAKEFVGCPNTFEDISKVEVGVRERRHLGEPISSAVSEPTTCHAGLSSVNNTNRSYEREPGRWSAYMVIWSSLSISVTDTYGWISRVHPLGQELMQIQEFGRCHGSFLIQHDGNGSTNDIPNLFQPDPLKRSPSTPHCSGSATCLGPFQCIIANANLSPR